MRNETFQAIYTGKNLPGVQGTGETLPTGAEVRVISTSAHLGAMVALVDLPSSAFGTGRTYTVWSIPGAEIASSWADRDFARESFAEIFPEG